MSANRASSNGAGGTALHGQIDAIGIFDLLRIAVTQQSTGRLLLFNDEMDASLYYEQGRLIDASCGSQRGATVLSSILEIERGEFEYVRGLVEPPGIIDERLHETLVLAIKQHYRARVGARRDGGAIQQQPYLSGVHPVASRSEVDAGWPEPAQDIYSEVPAPSNRFVSTPSNGRVSTPPNSAAMVGQPPLARGEVGRAIADGSGRVIGRLGQITSHETTCAALTAKLSYDLAAVLGTGNLQRFELNGSGKALLCRVAEDGLHVSQVDSAPDLEAVWQGLEP